jgi:hypothetical protein
MTDLPPVSHKNSTFSFISKACKLEIQEESVDKAAFVRLEFCFMGLSSLASIQAMQAVIVKNGCAEDLVNLLLTYCNIEIYGG